MARYASQIRNVDPNLEVMLRDKSLCFQGDVSSKMYLGQKSRKILEEIEKQEEERLKRREERHLKEIIRKQKVKEQILKDLDKQKTKEILGGFESIEYIKMKESPVKQMFTERQKVLERAEENRNQRLRA